MLKLILFFSSILLMASFNFHFLSLFRENLCWCEDSNITDVEKNIKQILTEEEWNRYLELKEIDAKRKEISIKYWQSVGPSFDVKNPKDKEQAERYKEELDMYDKIWEKKAKEFWEILAPQQEKAYLLGVEIDKIEPESSAWIFASIFSDIKTNSDTLLKSYLYFHKYQNKMRESLKGRMIRGIFSYLENINFHQEKDAINEALKFLEESKKPQEEKVIVMQFLWDVWSKFFPRIEKMENKKEIYGEMNKQVLNIVEKLKNYLEKPELSAKSKEILEKFKDYYLKQDLPEDFKNTEGYTDVIKYVNRIN
ncbi:MAG TPA: hypothetical protein PK165_03395 [bacterium]|nr:hypothetical protein [bacterium]HPO51861.1 hypothetical protein [bacterium]